MKIKVLFALGLSLFSGALVAQDFMGAFQIVTTPPGADIVLYDSDQFLCNTPSPVYPVVKDDYVISRDGIQGREITLIIAKDGYIPRKEVIFVPMLYYSESSALENPIVYDYHLERDLVSAYRLNLRMQRVSTYYPYSGYVDHGYSPHPWYPPSGGNYGYPPGHGGNHDGHGIGDCDDPPNHPGGGGGNGGGGPGGGGNPPNPPGGGGGHGGGGHGGGNPPNPPGGGVVPPEPPHGDGHDGNGHGGNENPPSPPGGGGNGGGSVNPPNPPTPTNPPQKPEVKPPNETKPNLTTQPDKDKDKLEKKKNK